MAIKQLKSNRDCFQENHWDIHRYTSGMAAVCTLPVIYLAHQMLVMRYRQLASLGTQAAQEQWGVDPFDEKHRDTHSFAKRVGRLPEQQDNDDVDYRGLLHRDGSVISAVTLQVG